MHPIGIEVLPSCSGIHLYAFAVIQNIFMTSANKYWVSVGQCCHVGKLKEKNIDRISSFVYTDRYFRLHCLNVQYNFNS